jgi:phage portal protein BeeE
MMPNLLSRLRRTSTTSERDGWFLFNGQPHGYTNPAPQTTVPGSKAETVGGFEDRIQRVHQRSGPVAAAVVARSGVMSELVFKWRNQRDGSLIGNTDLLPLERPHPDMTKQRWMSLLEMDVAYAGNAYTLNVDNRLYRLRPDWVAVGIFGDPDAADAEVAGYWYKPGGESSRKPPVFYSTAQVAHWAPEPLGTFRFLGESWVTSVLREIVADGQATDHLTRFFENAATPNAVITGPDWLEDPKMFDSWVDAMEESNTGVRNAWKNMYVSAGTDVNVVGSKMVDLGMENLQGGFETRIAVRSRVPATVLGIREGMKGSALNSGNYDSTRRLWSDTWFTPYSGAFCAAHERLINPLAGHELAHDPNRVMFLQEDRQDAADIAQKQAATIRQYIDAGFDADASVAAVLNGDLAALEGAHSGLTSVQLTPPATGDDARHVPLRVPEPLELS